MNYKEALDFIHGTYKFGSKLGLDNIKALMKALGDPQNELKFVHVAGTNGKGSTSSMIASVLNEAGYKTGLYTSPFIEKFNERMQIDGKMIEDAELAEITGIVKEKVEKMVENGHAHPTEFEVVTAIGFLYFKRNDCDIVVLEVGLGGRLDATNVIKTPLISVITPIDLDHVEYLGDTYAKIAGEKAGIIKEKGIVVSYPQNAEAMNVILEKSQNMECNLIRVCFDTLRIHNSNLESLIFEFENNLYEIGLIAPYQAENAAVAIKTLEELNRMGYEISREHIKRGLTKARWMARMEVVSKDPLIVIDGAHNVHGIKGLAEMLKRHGHAYEVVGIMGILKDKDFSSILSIILPVLDVVVTSKPDNPRAMSSLELADKIKDRPVIGSNDQIEAAVKIALEYEGKTDREKMIICFGSLYMVGGARQFVNQLNRGK